jgi:hypothetical protein
MVLKTWIFTEGDITLELNVAKDMLLKQLATDGIIPIERVEPLAKEYLFICAPLSILGNFWKKICGKEDHSRRILTKIPKGMQEALTPPEGEK